MFAPNLDHHPGDTLDHFKLEEVVASGGMATVFRAHDLRSGLQVAIKVPHPEVESDPSLWERFRREEEIGTRIVHPGVMRVLANPDRSSVYMVMEWIDGRLLRQIMNEQRPMPPERAARLVADVCHALEHIHAHGIVHRDLKPENIMVDAQDGIHLIDFGIAGAAGARRLTFTGFSQSFGTPDYLSPEQVKGRRGDARSDIYSMGVMLYEMLTGQVPFTGANPFAVMNDRLLNQPIAPRQLNPAIPPVLQEIVFRAMEREPKNRYGSAREMAHDLEHPEEVGVTVRAEETAGRTRHSPTRRRALLFAGLALIPVVLFGLLWVASRHQ